MNLYQVAKLVGSCSWHSLDWRLTARDQQAALH
jgi:hypothetical protein